MAGEMAGMWGRSYDPGEHEADKTDVSVRGSADVGPGL